MGERVEIHASNFTQPLAVADNGLGRVRVGSYCLDRRELEAALIVATGQRCNSFYGELRVTSPGDGNWPERLLAERHPPPEQWETCPVTDVQIGDTVRFHATRKELVVWEIRRRPTQIGFFSTRDDVSLWCALGGFIDRLVKP